ncbi:MAG: hypothetical protein AVDCRST_MAG64-3952 [uncultured Phycisphaerae bacterium]|uniref:Uncharacterized protein n=1 Tax=uncultured Phycisphaerae bacterium TaxID=904963 RepID=A0A6J4QD25_9BACT|nr:MAG: hypothetical protein AVDCRST_MAG64-3952 [uncultured Phycisphaerae bacterium]
MSSLTQPHTETQDDAGIAPGADDDAPRAQGRVRGQRLEITSADLTMYAVITGRRPSTEERQRALTWGETDPLHAHIAAAAAALPMQVLRPWHPAALSLRLREIWFNGITFRSTRPQLGRWARRLSGALHDARQRLRPQAR